MEYIFTNLPQYIKINSRSEFSSSVVSSGAVLLFTEDGITLTGKLPDGTFITIGGSGSGGTDPVGNATADDILAGKSATVSGGSVISGTIPTVSATSSGSQINVPSGYISASQTFTFSSGGVDVSDTTAIAADVLSGKVFYNSGGIQTTGTIPTVSASLSANMVNVPSGYISSAQTLTVPLASSATVSGGIITIPQGYVSAAYPVSDTNLVASNIASGVTIFDVEGSLNAGSPVDLIQVTSYTAPVPEFTVPEVYSMSGMTSAANPWDPEEPGIDFSVLNGTYTVTSDTASATNQLNRIYKHDSANYYLRHYSDEYDHCWLLGSAADMGVGDAMLSLNTADPLNAGTQTWYNMNYEASQSVTAAITSSATIPAVPMVLFGQMITSVTESAYDSARGVRTFVPDGPNVSFSAADETPVVSGLAMVSGGRMLMQLRDSCTQTYGDFVANQVLSGGTQYVSSGYVYYNNSIFDGELRILSGGTAVGNTVNNWGSMYVNSGGVAISTTLTGTDSYRGKLYVSNGGTATDTTINPGCSMYISAGGTANGVTVNSSATLDVHSGITVNSITVKDGGKLFVYSGGTANNVTSETGATVNVYEGGVITYA